MEKECNNEMILEGLPVNVISYRVGAAFVMEVELSSDNGIKVSCVGETEEAALYRALNSLSKRLQHYRDLTLTVGG